MESEIYIENKNYIFVLFFIQLVIFIYTDILYKNQLSLLTGGF